MCRVFWIEKTVLLVVFIESIYDPKAPFPWTNKWKLYSDDEKLYVAYPHTHTQNQWKLIYFMCECECAWVRVGRADVPFEKAFIFPYNPSFHFHYYIFMYLLCVVYIFCLLLLSLYVSICIERCSWYWTAIPIHNIHIFNILLDPGPQSAFDNLRMLIWHSYENLHT